MKDYYEILEVNEKASSEIIEKAYKTLVKKYHPDLYSTVEKKQAEKKLKDINEAYQILSDSFLRSQYDLELQKEKNRNQKQVKKQTDKNPQHEEDEQEKERGFRNKRSNSNPKSVRNKSNVGTIFGIIDLVQEIWKNKPQGIEKKKMNQKDWLAIGLTIIAVMIIGVLLWFIPFTNGWMRQLLFENPIFDLIGGLFS